MRDNEWNSYRRVLETRRAELLRELGNREGIEIEKSADALDEVQNATERELAILNLDRDSVLLRNINAALDRMKDSTYGVCLRCEEEISPRRLAAVPWASFCLKCQEEVDQETQEQSSRWEKTAA